jgi:hypothetical protein
MEETKKLLFIDIVYYKCFTFYRRFEKDLNEFSGQALTSVCLSLNTIAIIIILEKLFRFSIFENKFYTLFVSLPILGLTIIRYNKQISINEIEYLLNEKEISKQKFLDLLAFLYVTISIFGSIIFAIILGEINNPPPFWEKWFN